MRARFVLCLGLILLAACSYHYELKAVERNGRIIFEPKDDRGTGCFSDFNVTAESGEVTWDFIVGQYLPPPCKNELPVIYGRVPAGANERVKAAPLRPGILYKVEAWDGDSYSGAFRFREGVVVENIDNPRQVSIAVRP